VRRHIEPDKLAASQADNDQNVEPDEADPMVGTTNKSMAAMCGAWLCMKVPQL